MEVDVFIGSLSFHYCVQEVLSFLVAMWVGKCKGSFSCLLESMLDVQLGVLVFGNYKTLSGTFPLLTLILTHCAIVFGELDIGSQHV